MSPTIPLYWYLVFAAALFCLGLFGMLTRKNMVAILMFLRSTLLYGKGISLRMFPTVAG